MTPKQIELARHALGLPNDRNRSYRNRFVASPNHHDYADWMAMVSDGAAERERGFSARADWFFLTRTGAETALNPEDFPQVAAMKPIHTYGVSVEGFPEALYSARTPAKARARAWRSYSSYRAISFREFLSISSVRRAPNPPGIGDRILVGGKPATRAIGHGHYVYFIYDDGDDVLCSHPSDVEPAPAKEE